MPETSRYLGVGNEQGHHIEPVEGLGCAYERMKEISAKERGPYFILDAHSHKVLASVDTTAKSNAAKSA